MNEHEYIYTIILDPDLVQGGYMVTVPARPGRVPQGDTLEAAIAMAKDATKWVGPEGTLRGTDHVWSGLGGL
jgi:hypothetical protein